MRVGGYRVSCVLIEFYVTLFCASKYRSNERAVAGQLFKLFNSIVVSENVNQRTSFVQAFFCEMIKCDSATTTFLAQFIPPNMVS